MMAKTKKKKEVLNVWNHGSEAHIGNWNFLVREKIAIKVRWWSTWLIKVTMPTRHHKVKDI